MPKLKYPQGSVRAARQPVDEKAEGAAVASGCEPGVDEPQFRCATCRNEGVIHDDGRRETCPDCSGHIAVVLPENATTPPPIVKVEGDIETTRFYQTLRCPMSDEQRLGLGVQLAEVLIQKGKVEAEKKAAVAEFKERLDDLGSQASGLARSIEDGHQPRQVECVREIDRKAGTTTERRLDTGEQLEAAPVDTAQMNLKLGEPVGKMTDAPGQPTACPCCGEQVPGDARAEDIRWAKGKTGEKTRIHRACWKDCEVCSSAAAIFQDGDGVDICFDCHEELKPAEGGTAPAAS